MSDLEKFETFFKEMEVPFRRTEHGNEVTFLTIDSTAFTFSPAGEMFRFALSAKHNKAADCGCIPEKITCPRHAAVIRKELFDEVEVCPYCCKTDCTCRETA
jgi:hypothetical protein